MTVSSLVLFNLCVSECFLVCVCVCVQDVDSAYLVKADLEDKVGSLTDEINFLRNIYEEVPQPVRVSVLQQIHQLAVFLHLHSFPV